MSVSTTTNRIAYTGNGAATVYAYDFRILDKAHLEVYVAAVLKTLTTDYTVSGIGSATGGNVTFVVAPASAAAILIRREVPSTQAVDYDEYGPFPANTHEDVADKLTMIVQQIIETFGRALKFAKTSSKKDIDVPDPVANKVLGWDATAAKLENRTVGIETISVLTSLGDLIQGIAGGTAERLAIGARGAILRVTSALKAGWLAVGANGELLGSDGTDPAWRTMAAALKELLTTRGDLAIRDATTAVRLAIGAAGKYLRSDGTDPSWNDVDRVKESGGQVLTLGAVADTEYLKRSGTTIVSGAVATAESGTWSSVIGSRAKDTVYQNTSGKKRRVVVAIEIATGAANNAQAQVGAANPPTIIMGTFGFMNATAGPTMNLPISFEVPNNHYYRLATNAGTIAVQYWVELDE